MKDFLKDRFCTFRAWVWNCIFLAVLFGWLAYNKNQESEQYELWWLLFRIALVYPAGMIVFQLLNPIFKKRGVSWPLFLFWLCTAPTTFIAWIYNYSSIVNQSPEALYWLGLSVVSAGFFISSKIVLKL